jgi:DNA-binding winged helix-turn-helix (wHTH) protein/tetratricopeptide (TPR) repeat protein
MKQFAAFRLDPVNQCLWRRSDSGEFERILLTPTEFSVLDHLVEHAGRLVTHSELLDAVWPRMAIEPQVVKSKIFQLRRLLEDDPKHPRFIETLTRRGYRFVALVERAVTDAAPSEAPRSSLVGRQRALAVLEAHLRQALAGKPQLVFVTGEPGIGKSALVEEFGRLITSAENDVRIAHGQCVEGFASKEPFYPVLTAIGTLCHLSNGDHIVGVLASHAPTWLAQFPSLLTPQLRERLQQEILGATRERMLREICEALEVASATAPMLLVLEDLHWADSSTLDFLSAFARRRGAAKLMIIGTYRPSDVARSAQPLHALKRDLVARHLCQEMILQPLTESEIAQYLGDGGSTPDVDNALALFLHSHTEGNPLFMIGMLEHLLQRGLVEHDRGMWRLRQSAAEIEVEVPESLRQMISTQIDGLEDEEQRVLEIAAIAGTSFTPALSAPTADIDSRRFEDCCEGLWRRGQFLRMAGTRELPTGEVLQQYSFAHSLYREVLYERQSPARRAMLHRRRAERLEEVFAATLDEVAIELAHHFEKGADWARAVKYLRHAAEVSANRGSIHGATGNLQHALALAAKLPLPDRASAETEILDALADLYLGTFDPTAIDVLMLLRERAAAYGMIDVEAKALVDLCHPVSWASGEQALDIVEQALRLSDKQTDPLMRACTRAGCMVRRIWTRGWNANDAYECRRSLAEIRRLAPPHDVAWHVLDCNFVDFFSSNYRKAVEDARASLAVLARGPHGSTYLTYAHSLKEFSVSWSLTMLGEWGSALREMDTGIALATKNGDPYRGHTLLVSRAWALLLAMDFSGACATAESLFPEVQQRAPWRRFCLVIAGAADAGLGNHEQALERLLQAGEEMDRHFTLGDWYWRLLQRWALTNLWLSRGDVARATETAEAFLAGATATAERTWQALALQTNAQLALQLSDTQRAQALIENALTVIEGFEAPIAAWQVHATAADIARARGDASADKHQSTSRNIIRDLADSLGPEEQSLRQTFLSAPAVMRVLERNRRVTKSQPKENDFSSTQR